MADTNAEPEGGADVRADLARGLEGKLTPDQIATLIDEVLAITKPVNAEFSCKHCGKKQRHTGQMSDARAVVSSLAELMNQSWGKQTDDKRETEIIVNRQVILVAEPEEDPDGIAGDTEPD
jgi:hypothetical protein